MPTIKNFTFPIYISPLVYEIAHSISKLFLRVWEMILQITYGFVNQFSEKGKLTEKVKQEHILNASSS